MIEKYDLSFLNLDKIKQLLLKIDLAEHGLLSDGKSSFNYGMPILMYPELQSLYIVLKQYVKQYCNDHNIPELKFINSWFNITNPGNKLKAHNHGEEGLSGAFYVSVGKKSTPLIFSSTQIKPYSGLLIIFPSSFTHYTEEEQEQRVVISFNTNHS
jgi:hypothetical protein